MDGIAQSQMVYNCGGVCSVVIHIVAVRNLG